MMQLPMRLEELHRIFFPNLPENVIPFVRHHNKAVIQHDSILILPVTPPVTTSHQTVGTSIATQNDENTPVHADAINGPVPHDGIGPISERNPGIENAVNSNFNDVMRNPTETNDDRNFHQDSPGREIEIPYVEFPSHAALHRQDSSTDTDNIRLLPPAGHQDLPCHRHHTQENYPILSHTSTFFEQKACSF
jgi:hypothetical protein